jgi:hypothetical protein
MTPVPNCTFEEMRIRVNLSEPSEIRPLNPFVNALLAGILAQNRETIETHFLTLSLLDFKHLTRNYPYTT